MHQTELSDVHIAILAGGSGTRLWPRSRRRHPKQLLDLLGERSMLQRTVDRVLPLVPAERIYILTSPDHASSIAEQLPLIPRGNILVEPSPRSTAPCLGLAAMELRQQHPGESIMLSLHADHTIAQEERFRIALQAAAVTARKGYIVTVGIIPSHPETGFGYIERAESLGCERGVAVYRVARFTEKPPREKARAYVESGRFYWNTGYFAWTLDKILDEFERLLPETYARLEATVGASDEASRKRNWERIAPVSIDVGIMERATNVAVVPCDMGWSDVGSWAAIHDLLPRDQEGNVVLGDGKHLGLDTSNSLVYSADRLVATIGLEGIIIVDAGDALLVLPKSRAQEVNALVRELRARGLEQYL